MTPKTKETLDNHLAAYQRLEKELPGSGHAWVRKLRQAGADRFRERGFPTPRDEAWKYTNVRPIADTPYQPRGTDAAGAVAASDLAPYAFDGAQGPRIVLVDGHYSAGLSRLEGLPDGARVQSLAEAVEEDPQLVEPHLGKHVDAAGDAFAALNAALWQDGALIHVPDGAIVEAPIEVLHVSTAPDEPAVSHVRNLIVAGAGSQVTVVETYGAADPAGADARYFTNTVTEVAAADNAHVDHYRIQREGDAAHHVSNTALHLTRDSNVRTANFSLGGKLVRNNLDASLSGEGGEAALNGLFALRDSQHVDNHTRINHLAPHCDSREYYKGVLDEKARGVFYGLIYVAKGAQQTDSYQHNPNLLLSEDALVDSTPGLEIYADDVKCSHGSTIGQIDETQLFYLMSRGLDRDTARSLLVYAFAGEVIDRVKPEPVRARLQELILSRLPGGEAVAEAVAASQGSEALQ